nr:RecName: Full=Superoxide dismutase [Ni]; AltName: Full=NiSOD; AltName: Full=Nickel-containing superoxide dismutase [Streptomyces griseus]
HSDLPSGVYDPAQA